MKTKIGKIVLKNNTKCITEISKDLLKVAIHLRKAGDNGFKADDEYTLNLLKNARTMEARRNMYQEEINLMIRLENVLTLNGEL